MKVYTVNNFAGNLKQISERFKINYGTLYRRINMQGMSIEEAVNTPIGEFYTVNGFTGNLNQIAKRFNLNYGTLRSRINKQGMSIEEAVNTPVEEIHIVNGFTGKLKQIAERFNINNSTLRDRVNKGWSIEDSVNTPVKEQKEREIKIYTVNGFTGNLKEIAKHFDIKYTTLINRINKRGMSIEEAVNTSIKNKK